MSQADDPDSTVPPGGGNPFPAIIESVVGAGLVQTTDANDLHRFLKVGRDFATWIGGRLKKYGFVENVDYVVVDSPDRGNQTGRGGDRKSKAYYLTLDTAKEIAMVENNEQGRAARRYFIECERRALTTAALDAREVGGITKKVVRKAIADLLPDLLSESLAIVLPSMVREKVGERQHAVVQGVCAGQVLDMAGVPQRKGLRGLASWLSRRLFRFHATRGVQVRLANLGSRSAYVYDPLICREWLAAGGKAEIEKKVAERRGQGSLRLV